MSNEKLETALYEKMAAEQQAFREKLLRLSPEEILEKSREYVTRDNILKVLGEYPGTEMQTKTLLKSHTPLADIYAEMEKQGSDYGINEIKDCVALYTDAILTAERRRSEPCGSSQSILTRLPMPMSMDRSTNTAPPIGQT